MMGTYDTCGGATERAIERAQAAAAWRALHRIAR